MRRLRRATALLMHLLILQLTLGGAGATCVTPGSEIDHGPGRAAAAMLNAAAPGHSPSADSGMAETECPESDDRGGHAPCPTPFSPSVCMAMTSCMATLSSGVGVLAAFAATPSRVAAVSDLEPSGPASSPEPPPPRA